MKTQSQPRPTVKEILDEQVTLTFECLDRVYLNGHEWAKRQLEQEGIGFEALDNGFWRCEKPVRLQALCDQLGPEHIQEFLNRWLERLPFPLEAADRQAGYSPQLSIWQMEYSLTRMALEFMPSCNGRAGHLREIADGACSVSGRVLAVV